MTMTIGEADPLTARARAHYLDLLDRSLCNSIVGEGPIEMMLAKLWRRLRHPYATRHGAFSWPVRAHTMIGGAGLRNLRELMEATVRDDIPGDYIKTGAWRGGACILMRGVLAAYDVRDRRVFCADSFEGLPQPDRRGYPADKGDRLFAFEDLAIPEAEVRRNFAAYDLLDDQVVFLKGLFKDTLPGLAPRRFALLRLDGDMYESTFDALLHLYDLLSQGGFVIVDDYGVLKSCRAAAHDFLERRALQVDMQKVDHAAVWWRKPC
jgi:O-methyltransferase